MSRYNAHNALNRILYEHVPHEIGLCSAQNLAKDKSARGSEGGVNEHHVENGCWGVD